MPRQIRGMNYSQTHVDIAPIDHALDSLRNLGISSTIDQHASPHSLFDVNSYSHCIGKSDWELDILSAASMSYAKLINESKIPSLAKAFQPLASATPGQSPFNLYSTDSFASFGLESTFDKTSPGETYLDPAIHSLDSRTLASRRASTHSLSRQSFASSSTDTCGASSTSLPWEHDIISASSSGLVRTVTDLLARGSDPSSCDNQGWTPVMHAANMGHFSVLKLLVNHGATVDVQEPLEGKTALMLAASNGHTRCVEILISSHADRMIVDHQGNNAAYYAVANGHGNNHLMSKYLQLTRPRGNHSRSGPAIRRPFRH